MERKNGRKLFFALRRTFLRIGVPVVAYDEAGTSVFSRLEIMDMLDKYFHKYCDK